MKLITITDIDPATGRVSYVVRAAIPVALAGKVAVSALSADKAIDEPDLAERAGTIEGAPIEKIRAALERIQKAFQAEVDAGGLDRWKGTELQFDGKAWV